MRALAQQAPWVFLAFHTLVSAGGLLCQVHDTKEGRAAAEKLWTINSGVDVDFNHARRLGNEVLEAALRTQLGTFFAASTAAGFAASLSLATKALFLGQLSATETSRLTERLCKFALLKVVALAVCAPTYGELWTWVGWAVVMGQAYMFVELASMRGDALLSSTRATPGQHMRILALLGGILAQDVSWIAGYVGSGMSGGSLSQAALWLFDAVFVAVDAAFSLAKYAVHAADHLAAAKAEARGEEREPWEGRSHLVYWLELGSDACLHALMLAHYLHIWWLHGLQVQLIDFILFLDVRFTLGTLGRLVSRHLAYRRLQHRLRHAFPDATPAQLEAGPCCICLCGMKAGKRLPCSHAMHTSCLCAWLQQSQGGSFSCPLCRASLDIEPRQQTAATPATNPGAQRQQRRPSVAQRVVAGPHPLVLGDPWEREAGQACIASPSPQTQHHHAGAVATAEGQAPAVDCAPSSASAVSPSRPFTRLQARLAAAAAAAATAPSAAAPAAPPRHAGRGVCRIDRFFE